jgi:hypothetical protein
MGLLGCPASFQRLMETVLRNISNVLVSIDDVLLNTATHEEHLQMLEKVFERLHQNHLKVNLEKCVFGNREVSYLGFMLTPEGIKPGRNKLQAIRDAHPPTNIKMVRSFVGLCNFFRTHIKDFAIIAAPLFTATGSADFTGGLGAILTQMDEHGNHYAISFASRQLKDHEKNYSPVLLEAAAAVWGMESFDEYLRGKQFILYTDHKPLEKLGHLHAKTLNRLQTAFLEHDFIVQYKKAPACLLIICPAFRHYQSMLLKHLPLQPLILLRQTSSCSRGKIRVCKLFSNSSKINSGQILFRNRPSKIWNQ